MIERKNKVFRLILNMKMGEVVFFKDWDEFFELRNIDKQYLEDSLGSYRDSMKKYVESMDMWSSTTYKIPDKTFNPESELNIEMLNSILDSLYLSDRLKVDSIIYDKFEEKIYLIDSRMFKINIDVNRIKWHKTKSIFPMWQRLDTFGYDAFIKRVLESGPLKYKLIFDFLDEK